MTDLIKAADALAEAVNEQLAYMDLCGDKGDLERNMRTAHTAYRQARESAGDGVNAAALSEDIENILWDHVYCDRGEVSGLHEACDKIHSRIKAALDT